MDANNLYGWAMIKKLPVGKFQWIHPNDYTEDLIKSYDDTDDCGAILEVDIEYPKELLNKHNGLPSGKNKKVIGKFKNELNGKIMTELCSPMPKTYAFITDNDTEIKRAKGTKNV